MHQELISHIQSYIALSDTCIGRLSDYVESVLVENKEYLLKEGEVCRNHYFVKKGCLRMFYNSDRGVEQIIQFAIKGWWLTDYLSLANQQLSIYNIQAVGKTEILSISQTKLDQLTEEFPILERYFRIILQRALGASQFRQKLMFDLSKEELYLHFSSTFPEFTQQVPQYMLASFLGITPEYLSEIRRKQQ